jgi:hypothetical protein
VTEPRYRHVLVPLDGNSIFAGGGEGALLDVQPDREGFHASICFALPGRG